MKVRMFFAAIAVLVALTGTPAMNASCHGDDPSLFCANECLFNGSGSSCGFVQGQTAANSYCYQGTPNACHDGYNDPCCPGGEGLF